MNNPLKTIGGEWESLPLPVQLEHIRQYLCDGLHVTSLAVTMRVNRIDLALTKAKLALAEPKTEAVE